MQKRFTTWVFGAMLVLAFIGFLDATYLTVQHYTGGTVKCVLVKGCDVVLVSDYATLGFVPVALLGSLYYLVIFILTVFYLDTRSSLVRKYIPYLTLLGFLASCWYVYLMLFVIKKICIYCMGSATTSTLLFILGITLFLHDKKNRSLGANLTEEPPVS